MIYVSRKPERSSENLLVEMAGYDPASESLLQGMTTSVVSF